MNLCIHLCVIFIAIIFGMVGALIVAVISVSFELLIKWISKKMGRK